MRYGPDDKFWVVVDPTPESEMGDLLFETSLRGLDLQFKGGLTMAQNPTIFTDQQEAKYEAMGGSPRCARPRRSCAPAGRTRRRRWTGSRSTARTASSSSRPI